MKKQANYSVLFMRDDTDVRSFRVSPKRLRVLLWVSSCLGVVLLISLVIGVRSFVGYRVALSEKRDLEVKLAEALVDVERAGNIGMMQKAQEDKGGKVSKESAKAQSSAPAGNARAFSKVHSGAIAVENMRSSVSGGSLTTTFDLNNRGGAALSGEVGLFLLRNDGTLTPLEAPSADLTFQIQRFKHISASAKVPSGLPRREVLGLRVEIKNSEGETILGETYPLGS